MKQKSEIKVPQFDKKEVEEGYKKIVEAVEETKPETVIETEPQKSMPEQVLQVMSEEDAYIADRMKSQPKTLDDILTVKETKYAPGEHRLSLPKEFRPYQDRFGFRWLNKKKRAIDDAIIKGWVLVNRTLFPDVAKEAKHLFSTSGAVEKGDALLACIALHIAESIRKAPSEKSKAVLKSQLDRGKQKLSKEQSGFYEPKEDVNEQ